MKHGADWLAWSMQFVVGLVVGFFAGYYAFFYLFRRSFRYLRVIQDGEFITHLLGCALIGAGLASLLGDGLWTGSSNSYSSTDGIRHSNASQIASIIFIALGCVLIVKVFLARLGIF